MPFSAEKGAGMVVANICLMGGVDNNLQPQRCDGGACVAVREKKNLLVSSTPLVPHPLSYVVIPSRFSLSTLLLLNLHFFPWSQHLSTLFHLPLFFHFGLMSP